MPKNKYQEKLAELTKTQDQAETLIAMLQDSVDSLDQVNVSSAKLRNEITQLNSAKVNANAQIATIDNFHAQLTSIKTQIDAQLADAKNENTQLAKNINQYEEGYKLLISKINEQQQRSNDLMKSAEETLNLATSTALSKDFGERASRVAKSRTCWAAIIIIYLLSAGTAVVLLSYGQIIDVTDLWNVKTITLVPFIYLLYFLVRQFHRSRDLEEKYTFKSLMSKTLENNIKLLKDEFGKESNEQRLNFAIKTMENIYSNPTRQTFMSVWLESRLAKFGIKEETNTVDNKGGAK